MSDAVFWGCLLLAAGPPAVTYCLVIARKSFLILLSLARYAKQCSQLIISDTLTYCELQYLLLVSCFPGDRTHL